MNACAYIVGPADGPGAALMDMAHRLAFDIVQPFSGVAQADAQLAQTPLLFFLFAAVNDPHTLKKSADAIRLAGSRKVRFSPLIYFSESPSLEAIRQCIHMGFDDVITLPFTLKRVIERINRQIDSPLVYYETASYFGPDRRDRLPDEPVHSGRGTGGQFRRFEITRSIKRGVSITRDDEQVVI